MLSKRQAELLSYELPRITILDGAISSGKTFIGNNKSISHLVNNYKGDGLVFFIGKTLDTLEKNILLPLERQFGASYFTYSKGAKKANLCGIPIELEGCNDIRAEAKIRGTTAEFIYGDELTLWNKSFLTRCMGSLRTPDAKFLGTTNPDTPNNFVYTDFIQRKNELDMLYLRFMMDDNPVLTEKYKKEVNLEYTGVFHDRFIKGLWVAAEGVIYRQFADNANGFLATEDESKQCIFHTIGGDFGGTRSAQAFNCTGFLPKLRGIITTDEYYSKEPMDADELADNLALFVRRQLDKGCKIREIRLDSAEPVLIRTCKNALRKAGIGIPVLGAIKGRTNDRIKFYSMLMAKGAYKVLPHCKHTIEAFSTALWNSKKLEDERLDDYTTNIDSLDAQEYSTEPYQKQMIDILMLGGKKDG